MDRAGDSTADAELGVGRVDHRIHVRLICDVADDALDHHLVDLRLVQNDHSSVGGSSLKGLASALDILGISEKDNRRDLMR